MPVLYTHSSDTGLSRHEGPINERGPRWHIQAQLTETRCGSQRTSGDNTDTIRCKGKRFYPLRREKLQGDQFRVSVDSTQPPFCWQFFLITLHCPASAGFLTSGILSLKKLNCYSESKWLCVWVWNRIGTFSPPACSSSIATASLAAVASDE